MCGEYHHNKLSPTDIETKLEVYNYANQTNASFSLLSWWWRQKHILHRQPDAGTQAKMFGFADIVTESTKIGYNSNASEESISGQT